ncbi:hypothetical protein AGMMS49975_22140 [Clostridia bacterium]|nr:hypothetical protein AGMMS49975_22140 [Clostridia bacterium]
MLKHISIWNDEHGWQQITAQKAHKIYPCGLLSSKQFLCESCGQYANFVVGENQPPHFRHKNYKKYCEEKSTYSNNNYTSNIQRFSLPLKVKITNTVVDVYIGFLPVSENVLNSSEILTIDLFGN